MDTPEVEPQPSISYKLAKPQDLSSENPILANNE